MRPVLAGSAITGEGVDDLGRAIVDLLPAASGDADGPLAAAVFKIERTNAGEKIAYVRVFSGTLHARERIGDEKVTAISVFDHGGVGAQQRSPAGPDRQGLGAPQPAHRGPDRRRADGAARVRAADARSRRAAGRPRRRPPPPRRARPARRAGPADRRPPGRRRASSRCRSTARCRRRCSRRRSPPSTGSTVAFRETTPIYVERVVGTGEAAELLNAADEPVPRAARAARRAGDGIEVRVEVVDHSAHPAVRLQAPRGVRRRDGRRMCATACASATHGWQVDRRRRDRDRQLVQPRRRPAVAPRADADRGRLPRS